MFAPKRLLTRGNTALAGMLLVSILGAAAIALDSASVERNPYGLTAMSRLASVDENVPTGPGTEPATPSGSQRECQPGYKYEVRVVEGKENIQCQQVFRCTNFPDVKQDTVGCHVVKPVVGVLPQGSQNQCKPAVESQGSEVFLCLRKGLTASGQEECKPTKRCLPGGKIDATQTRKEYEGKLVADQLKIATNEADQNRIRSELKQDPQLSQGVFDAFGKEQTTIAQQQGDLSNEALELNRQRADAQRRIDEINKLGEYEKWTKGEELMKAQADMSAADKRLAEIQAQNAKLAEESKRLAGLGTQLQPTTQTPPIMPPTTCVGERCIVGPDGKVTLDSRHTTFPANPCSQNPNAPGCKTNTYSEASYGPPRGGGNGAGNGLGGGNPLGNLLGGLFGQQQQDNFCVMNNGYGGTQVVQGMQARPGCMNYRDAMGNQPYNPYNQQQQQCSQFGSMTGQCQQYPRPTCTLTASPSSISAATSSSQRQNVTLTWQTQNAMAANLSNVGNVAPSGSMVVQPTGATTYTMNVMGYQNQQGQCTAQVTVGGQGGGGAGSPTAQISCEPKIVDPGMNVAISYACQNASSASGTGFSTSGGLSGSTEAAVAQPAAGASNQTFSLTCSRDGQTHSSQCTVQVNKPTITLVATPSKVRSGQQTTIGWVTGGMQSCVISSPTLSVFTAENESNTSPSGSAKTPALTGETEFVLRCVTKAGGTRTATIKIEIDNSVTSWLRGIGSRFF